jgi:hypothetical protein
MFRMAFWLKSAMAALSPARRIKVVVGDTLPDKLPRRDLVVAREDEEDWSVGLSCPCGCGQRLEMMLLKQVKPRWDLTVDRKGRPTLRPSVWLRTGCRSHFWVRAGKIVWCE